MSCEKIASVLMWELGKSGAIRYANKIVRVRGPLSQDYQNAAEILKIKKRKGKNGK